MNWQLETCGLEQVTCKNHKREADLLVHCFKDKWGEKWTYEVTSGYYERWKDKFKIALLLNYNHMVHSVYEVMKEKEFTWRENMRMQLNVREVVARPLRCLTPPPPSARCLAYDDWPFVCFGTRAGVLRIVEPQKKNRW